MQRKKDSTVASSTAKRTMVNVRKSVNTRLDRLGKSRLWLAGQMKVRPATVYDFLNGKVKIQSDKVEKMLAALGLEIRPKE